MKKMMLFFVVIILTATFLPSGSQEFRFRVPQAKAELENILNEQGAAIRGTIGFYAKHVESGESVGVSESKCFQLASVFKIPVLVTLFKQIDKGIISLDDRIALEGRMKTHGSGLLTAMKPGLNLSIHDLQLLMMARSDNTATDILFDLVTPLAVADYMKELGLTQTTIDFSTRQLILAYLGLDPSIALTVEELRRVPGSFWTSEECRKKMKEFESSLHNTSTAFEMALLLEQCVKGEIVNRETSDKILETMKHHTGAEVILRYLPFGTVIARKGGSLAKDGENTVFNDAGVIWLPQGAGHLIICIFGNNLKEVHYELKHKMGMMCRAAYDYFLANNQKPKK